ncbi:PIR Superfamily Protein [Plasmodium ovale wallikeri]|uniref:PIR Superfamily Protein n=2 Tax=Plasmodium ovale TaxID=36330 RepID=A0A1A9AKF5_PLAOA|nr:PIR Superfamily Protein [Plasmodium ovale wallikeri]SBT57099.1 PIR Superfamily Protein [Plasmodium ovale wallikeri]SBT71994.1 PIR protein [Plasmodium ovale]
MPCNKEKSKYNFCINSNYYETLLQYVEKNSSEVKKEKKCDNLRTSMTFFKSSSATEICQEFKFLYKAFSIYSGKKTAENDPFSNYDCDFMNYWLNYKLRENVSGGSINVKDFYNEIKSKDDEDLSKNKELHDYMHIIDLDILENMKLLYKLYDNAVNIKSIIDNEVYINDEQKNKEKESCSKYTKECDEKYKEAMNRCLSSNVDFYHALKYFKDSYDIITKPSSNESNACNFREFYYFPEYDAVLEKKANTIKISSTMCILSLALALIYKFTPFGPFLRGKINMVRNRWLNPDENGEELLALSTDLEDHISDNEEYNIGYYSETN